MGNCIGAVMFPSQKKTTFKSPVGGEEEFEVSETVGKINPGNNAAVNFSSPRKALLTDGKLESGEVYCLIPGKVVYSGSPRSQRVAEDSCQGRRVKIVVSKQQLEKLLRSMKELQCSRIVAIQSRRTSKPCQKWKPSLATIPEL